MNRIVGSARSDSRKKYSGDQAGDQRQVTTPDYKGEVSIQTFESFVKDRNLYILRLKQARHAMNIANCMMIACNNKNVGYDQGNRFDILRRGVNSKTKTECDCSTLVRQCFKEATGTDPGNFTTLNEVQKLLDTGLVEGPFILTKNSTIYTGDILVTQTKGHTGIVVAATSREIFNTSGLKYNGVDYSPVFDPVYYVNKYSDLKNTYGLDIKLLFQHFIVFGMKEKRQAIDNFDVETYARKNPDVLAAATNKFTGQVKWPEIYRHYCIFGVKEGRDTV